MMKRSLPLFLVPALALAFLSACSKDDDNPVTSGSTLTPAGTTASAASAVVDTIGAVGDAQTSSGFLWSSAASGPHPAVPPGLTYNAADGYYALSGQDVKFRFLNGSDTPLALMGTDNNNPAEVPNGGNPRNAGLMATLAKMQFIVSGSEGGVAYTADLNGPADYNYFNDTYDLVTNLTISGTIALTGAFGTFNVTVTNVVVDSDGPEEGAMTAGTVTGTGTLPDSSSVSFSLTFNPDGTATGTATVGAQSVAININADGSGTYSVDGGPAQPIPA